VGRRRLGQDQTLMQTLLSEHSWPHLCCGLLGQRKSRRGQRRVDEDVGRRRVERCCSFGLCQQTRHGRDECS